MDSRTWSGQCGPDVARDSVLNDVYVLIRAGTLPTGGKPRAVASDYLKSVGTRVVDLLDDEANSFAVGVAALELALGLRAHDDVRQRASSGDSVISRGVLRDARQRHPDIDPKDLKYFLVHCPSGLDDQIAKFANDKKLLVESGLPLNKHEIRICARRRVDDVVQYATRYLENIDKLRGEFPDLRAHEAKPFAYQPIEQGRPAVERFLGRIRRTMEQNPALTRSMASKLSLMYRDQDEIKAAARERTT